MVAKSEVFAIPCTLVVALLWLVTAASTSASSAAAPGSCASGISPDESREATPPATPFVLNSI